MTSVVSGVGGGGWRGRAQQIQTLHQRLLELSEKTSNPEMVEKEASMFTLGLKSNLLISFLKIKKVYLIYWKAIN